MDGNGKTGSRRPVALLLPGQGAQHARMAAGLYGREPVFTSSVDDCLACFPDGAALRDEWLCGRPHMDIADARWAQPMLLAVDYALGRMVLAWGVAPVALLGHSVGETAAAVLAGVLSIAEAAVLTSKRVQRIQDTPDGGMLAVAASAAEVQPLLVPGVAVGAINAPRQTVLAGLDGPLCTVECRLGERGYIFRRLPSRKAFHSPAALPAADATDLTGVRLSPPRLPLYSAYTGALLTAEQATDPQFWAVHPVAPVRFWPALDLVLSTRPTVAIEAGPGQQLVSIARRHRSVASGAGAAWGLLPARPGEAESDRRALAQTKDRLRREGHLPGYAGQS